jgi:protein gp37
MTKIAWTDKTWNPVRGCSRVSEGCTNCYAERFAHRNLGGHYTGLTRMTSHGPTWTGEVRCIHEKLDEPLRWRKPRRVFVNSMSDLFHEKVPDEFIDRVFAVMAACQQHTSQILTKRPERMLNYMADLDSRARHLEDEEDREQSYAAEIEVCMWSLTDLIDGTDHWAIECASRLNGKSAGWPLPNVHLGVSVEDQKTADERIPLLLKTPATVRWVSYEPALGPICFDALWETAAYRGDKSSGFIDYDGLDWLVVGGESGPGARPCNVDWVRSTVGQCKAVGVPCFVKQLGSAWAWEQVKNRFPRPWQGRDRAGANPAEWPPDLRVQEWPKP